MLILTRQENQSIMIGDNVEITVVEVRGGKVRIGIDAPSEVQILRKEIYEDVAQKNRDAAASPDTDVDLDKLPIFKKPKD